LTAAADPGETISLDVSLRNNGARAAAGLTAQMLPVEGIESPGPAQDYGTLQPGAEAVRTFTLTVAASLKCGAVATPVLQLTESGEQLADIDLKLQTGKQAIALAENFDGLTAPGLPAGWSTSSSANHQLWRTSTSRVTSGTNAAFSPAPHQMGINELVSPAFTDQLARGTHLVSQLVRTRNHISSAIGFMTAPCWRSNLTKASGRI
jgi:hypothetical protein